MINNVIIFRFVDFVPFFVNSHFWYEYVNVIFLLQLITKLIRNV